MHSTEFNIFTNTLRCTWSIERARDQYDDIVTSDTFRALPPFDKYVWRLELCPQNAKYQSLFVRMVEPVFDGKVKVRISSAIIGDEGKALKKYHGREWVEFRSDNESCGGWPNFVKRRHLIDEHSVYLDDQNALTVRVKIRFYDSVLPTKIKQRALSLLVHDLQQLLGSETFADVQIKVDGQTIDARKDMLVKRCAVFAKMFESKLNEAKTNIIEINDVEFEVMRSLINYLNTGTIDRLMDTPFALKLFAAADKYQLGLLMTMCENFIVSGLDDDTVMSALVCGYLHCSPKIKNACYNYINYESKIQQIVHFKGWHAVTEYPMLTTECIERCTTKRRIMASLI